MYFVWMKGGLSNGLFISGWVEDVRRVVGRSRYSAKEIMSGMNADGVAKMS